MLPAPSFERRAVQIYIVVSNVQTRWVIFFNILTRAALKRWYTLP
jgi:hypothetical protein